MRYCSPDIAKSVLCIGLIGFSHVCGLGCTASSPPSNNEEGLPEFNEDTSSGDSSSLSEEESVRVLFAVDLESPLAFSIIDRAQSMRLRFFGTPRNQQGEFVVQAVAVTQYDEDEDAILAVPDSNGAFKYVIDANGNVALLNGSIEQVIPDDELTVMNTVESIMKSDAPVSWLEIGYDFFEEHRFQTAKRVVAICLDKSDAINNALSQISNSRNSKPIVSPTAVGIGAVAVGFVVWNYWLSPSIKEKVLQKLNETVDLLIPDAGAAEPDPIDSIQVEGQTPAQTECDPPSSKCFAAAVPDQFLGCNERGGEFTLTGTWVADSGSSSDPWLRVTVYEPDGKQFLERNDFIALSGNGTWEVSFSSLITESSDPGTYRFVAALIRDNVSIEMAELSVFVEDCSANTPNAIEDDNPSTDGVERDSEEPCRAAFAGEKDCRAGVQ